MMGVFYTPPENTAVKHLFWLVSSIRIILLYLTYLCRFFKGFNACQAATLSPLFFLSPAILSRAALYTAGIVGSLSYVGATARSDKYLYLGGPLLAGKCSQSSLRTFSQLSLGVTVVALSSLAPMVLPLGLRSLAFAESICELSTVAYW